jgi:MFS family permease
VSYLAEFRKNWRFLAAAGIGQAAGYSLVNYIGNLFTPHLLNQFGWSKSSVALVGATSLLGVIAQPVAGRLTDAIGVRRTALIGVVLAPAIFVGLSLMTGGLYQFFILSLLQVVVVGGTTTTVVYSRLIAQRFDSARGVALGIGACAAPAVAAVGVPYLARFIDASGWRAGYLAVALCTGVAGLIAIALMPAGTDARPGFRQECHTPVADYRVILRDPAIRLIIGATFLFNLSFAMQTSQLKVILLDRGIDSSIGSLAISAFASSVIVGRLLCGLALDRFPTYVVAAISLGLPGLGLGLLATGTSTTTLIFASVLLLGLSMGAEGDVLAYLVTRYFKREVYGTVLGIVIGALALSVATGSLLLGLLLKLSGSFMPFLMLSAVAVFAGSGMVLRLRRIAVVN